MRTFRAAALACALSLALAAQSRRQVIVDEDTAGPAGTDLNAVALLLQSPQVQVLGLTVVAGDGWLGDEMADAQRLLALLNQSAVPLLPGAAAPLLRTRAATAAWAARFAPAAYLGMWTNFPAGPRHPTPPAAEDAPHFLARMLAAHPGQITVFAGGPLTNLALALRLDPQLARHSAGLVLVGGSLGPATHDPEIQADPRREFNFWFDPDAARAVLRAPWPAIQCLPLDAALQTHLTGALMARLAKVHTPLVDYIRANSDTLGNVSYMPDELAALAWLHPEIVAASRPVALDVNTDPKSPGWGDTLLLAPAPGQTSRPLTAITQIHRQAFEDAFIAALGGR